jgi:hypothetical protein
VVLLDLKVELRWPGFALVTAVATKVSGGLFLGVSKGSSRRGFYRTNTGRDTPGLYHEFYLQFMISVKIFQKGMNLGRFRFEVDPTQTPARLRLEHSIHISGWLRAARRKAEDGVVAVDAIERTVTTAQHGARIGVTLGRGSLSQEMGREMGCTWGRQSGLQEKKRGSGPEGEN